MTVEQPEPHLVLVVDDDAEFAKSVADSLADVDIAVEWRDDPAAALALAGARPFDVAVVDLIMPGMDGLELAQALRRTAGQPEVIVLTGHADLQTAIAGLRQGLFDYLQKHALNPAQLRKAVRAAIARRAATRGSGG